MKHFFPFLLALLLGDFALQAQQDTLRGHDVLVLTDGQLLRGKVIEIGLETVTYKRAGYLNGPLYTLPRPLIYAINYPDGQSDYLNGAPFVGKPTRRDKAKASKAFKLAQNPTLSLGIGFIPSYGRGDGIIEDAQRNSSLPTFFLRYYTSWSSTLQLGVEVGTGGYTYTNQQLESYDNAIVSGETREGVSSLMFLARYTLYGKRLRPYILAGVGVRSSSLDTELTVLPLDTESGYRLSSGGRDTSLGLLLRAGGSYVIGSRLEAYFDAGTGSSLLQLGVNFNVGATPPSNQKSTDAL